MADTRVLGTTATKKPTPILVGADGTVAIADVVLDGAVAAPGAAVPTNVVLEGGIGKDTAPAAVADGTTVRAWFSRVGALFTRLNGPDNLDLFPAAAAPADGVTNAENTPSLRARLIGFNGTTWDRIKAGVTGAQSAATGFLNTLGVAKYNATRPVLLDTYLTELQANTRGDLAVAEQFRPQSQDDTNRVTSVAIRPGTLNAVVAGEYQFTPFKSSALAATVTGLASAAFTLYRASIRVDATAPSGTYFVQWFDVALAANVATGVLTNIPAVKVVHVNGVDDIVNFDFSPCGVYFAAGCHCGLSTAEWTYTNVGSYLSGGGLGKA